MWRSARKSDHGTGSSSLWSALPERFLLCCDARWRSRKGEQVSQHESIQQTGSAPAASKRVANPKTVLFVAAFAAFLATFNETFLNVGFAPIMTSLGVDVSTVQWLATAYMLGAAVMVPVSAFAYRSFPTRPLFCVTVALLVAGSVIGALADNFAVLLTGRIVQALGTGMLIPIGMNITLEIAPREKLGTYMGIMGAMTTLGPSSSVILAGVILAFFDWHMLLWAFGALSALCLIVGAVILRDIAKLTHPRLDTPSVALIGIALVGILYGVSTVFSGSIIIACAALVIGIVFMVLFVRRQNRIDEPLINLAPLKIAPFSIGVVVNMISLLTIFAMNIIVPTFMQSELGTPPLVASLILFPAILCSCAVSPIAGRVYDKHGPGVLLPLGFACIAVFSVLVSVFISTASPIVLALLYIPVICGSALIIGPVQSFALSKLSFQMNPHGVTIMSTGFQIAGCIGSSVFTGVYAAGGIAFGASTGMLIAGVLVGIVAVVGFVFALVIRREATRSVDVAEGESWETAEVALEARESSLADEPSLANIMKTDVFTLPASALISEALKLFSDKGISGAPVVDDNGELVGFVSDGDVMKTFANQVPAFKTAWSFVVERENADFRQTMKEALSTPVEQVATRNVICVNVGDDMGSVARTLAEHHLKKAPVMDGAKMVGIVNRSNLTDYVVRECLG